MVVFWIYWWFRDVPVYSLQSNIPTEADILILFQALMELQYQIHVFKLKIGRKKVKYCYFHIHLLTVNGTIHCHKFFWVSTFCPPLTPEMPLLFRVNVGKVKLHSVILCILTYAMFSCLVCIFFFFFVIAISDRIWCSF